MSLVLASEKHLVFLTIQKVGKWSVISNMHTPLLVFCFVILEYMWSSNFDLQLSVYLVEIFNNNLHPIIFYLGDTFIQGVDVYVTASDVV